jgi:hypothetical protein
MARSRKENLKNLHCAAAAAQAPARHENRFLRIKCVHIPEIQKKMLERQLKAMLHFAREFNFLPPLISLISFFLRSIIPGNGDRASALTRASEWSMAEPRKSR